MQSEETVGSSLNTLFSKPKITTRDIETFISIYKTGSAFFKMLYVKKKGEEREGKYLISLFLKIIFSPSSQATFFGRFSLLPGFLPFSPDQYFDGFT